MLTLKRLTGRTLLYLTLAVGALAMAFPFLWMGLSAFKTPAEIAAVPPVWWPERFSLENFARVFEVAPFAVYLRNSLLVTIACVLVTQVVSIMAAFAFSALRFKGRDWIFAAVVSLMVAPFELLIITNYATMADLRLIDTLPALVLPFVSSIFYMFIIRTTFQSVPEGLYWAARIDGASNWRYLWTILVPVARPTITTTSLLNAIAAWNAFMWPLLVINSRDKRTLPVGLYSFITEGGVRYELLMAAATVAVLPMLLVFAVASSQIIQGIARGGLKG
ncbi:MAG: carbohydrate ABC transporter permease [Bifidobacteriaceae bacterium]|jgi:multiple sugar transport system permease protein|nr:carbohydrate ABC transporter permease [Bifidobacteriaceae bacterium]